MDFAEQVVGEPLLPWQRWAAIHALELDPAGGGYRFRVVLILVARQNGKSSLATAAALWKLYVDGARLVLGVAQDLTTARHHLRQADRVVLGSADLTGERTKLAGTIGDERLLLASGAEYRISAANRDAGRGLSVDHLTVDEVRTQREWDSWAALAATTRARPFAQTWALSTMGDDSSVVLNQLREAALSGRDPTIGVFEWSALEGCELDDRQGWAAANPGLGYTISERAVASALGTDPPEVFRCLDVSTPILTRGGWSSLGAVCVGDDVKGVDGSWVRVTGVSPVHYGQECYRLRLNDGRTIVCDGQHLWTVRDRRRPGPPETLRTTDLLARGVTYRNPSMGYDVRNFSLPPVAPLEGPDADLPIHPYLLGLWLGDGSSRAAMVFVVDRDEEHIVAMMRSVGAEITTRVKDSAHCWRLGFRVDGYGAFTGALHDLGVYRNKHVPEVYLTGSYEQRLWLLRGLMDSDGTVRATRGRCVFTNTNGKLVDGVRTLVRSLGWKTSDLGPGRYGQERWQPRFDVGFTPRPDRPAPVTVPRKLANIRAAKNYRDVRPVTIASIEAVPTVPVRCVEVGAPDALFLAGDLVPTHNTETLCQRVDQLDGAVDLGAWRSLADASGSLDGVRDRVCLGLDVAVDGGHVSLVAAADLDDGRVRVEPVAAWSSTEAARDGLVEWVTRVGPRALAWFPSGPAAALAPVLRGLGCPVTEVKGTAVTEACMGLSDLVSARRLVHSGDPLLDRHVAGASKYRQGDGWRFARRGGVGHVDAAYAAAGAVHAVFTVPVTRPAPRPMVV